MVPVSLIQELYLGVPPQGSILGNFLFCATSNEFGIPTGSSTEPEDPISEELTSGEECQEESESDYDSDKDYPPNFRFFRRRTNILDETEISFRYTQEELDRELGVPEGWGKRTGVNKGVYRRYKYHRKSQTL